MRRVIIAMATATALTMTFVSAPAAVADESQDDGVVIEFAPETSEPEKAITGKPGYSRSSACPRKQGRSRPAWIREEPVPRQVLHAQP